MYLYDHGPTFPVSPFGGQSFYLTAVSGENNPGLYVYNEGSTTWEAFTDNSVGPPGTPPHA